MTEIVELNDNYFDEDYYSSLISNFQQLSSKSYAEWNQLGEDILGGASSISLSNDGLILASGNGVKVGIYKFNEGDWSQIGENINGEIFGDYFGNSVSISGDGSIVAIGAPAYHPNGPSLSNGVGQVKVFQNIDDNWIQKGNSITGSGSPNGGLLLGGGVSLSDDGSTLAIAGKNFVDIYVYNSGNWLQIGNKINLPFTLSSLDQSITLSKDGTTIAIGDKSPGYVKVFENLNNEWIQVGDTLTEDTLIEDYVDKFGKSISLSSDGSILAVSAPKISEWGNYSFVKVYQNIDNEWIQIGDNITPSEGNPFGNKWDEFGYDIELSNDGSILAATGEWLSGGNSDYAILSVYENVNNIWEQFGETIIEKKYGEKFTDVSINDEGTKIAYTSNSTGDDYVSIVEFDAIVEINTDYEKNTGQAEFIISPFNDKTISFSEEDPEGNSWDQNTFGNASSWELTKNDLDIEVSWFIQDYLPNEFNSSPWIKIEDQEPNTPLSLNNDESLIGKQLKAVISYIDNQGFIEDVETNESYFAANEFAFQYYGPVQKITKYYDQSTDFEDYIILDFSESPLGITTQKDYFLDGLKTTYKGTELYDLYPEATLKIKAYVDFEYENETYPTNYQYFINTKNPYNFEISDYGEYLEYANNINSWVLEDFIFQGSYTYNFDGNPYSEGIGNQYVNNLDIKFNNIINLPEAEINSFLAKKIFKSPNLIIGSTSGDFLQGKGGDDIIQGNGGDDIIYGGSGNDTLKDTEGNSIVYGGKGDDTIEKVYENTIVYGGPGFDTISFNEPVNYYSIEENEEYIQVNDVKLYEIEIVKFYDQIDWSLVDWSLIEFSKASELEGFSLSNVDWEELNSSKNSATAYKIIQNNYLSSPSGNVSLLNNQNQESNLLSSEIASQLDYSKIDFNKFSPSILDDINDLNFETLGKNYKKLKWDQINYSSLNDDSKDAIDWTKVNLKKATQSDSFDMDDVDWEEINTSKAAAKSYKAIDWENVSISSDVSALLDYSKVDFNKFSPSSLADINDLNFASLGKNYRKLKWDQIDYSELNVASKDAIDWTKVDLKKATKSDTFDMAAVDWIELNTSKSAAKSYKAIDWANVSISSDVSALLDYSKVDFNKFSPSSLDDINDLNFETLGKNYKKLKWDEIDYSALDSDSKEAIDWAQVNFNKATKSPTFELDDVDWAELNSSKASAKAYKILQNKYLSTPAGGISLLNDDDLISSDIAYQLDYSKINFKTFSPSSLANINDLNFETLGKNYKKLKWDQINYSALNDDSKDAIDWTKVNLKKAAQSEFFDMDDVDWAEINTSKSAAKSYKQINWSTEFISSVVAEELDFSKVDFKKLNLDNLQDINDLDFASLGKNYKKLKWDQIDYSELSVASKEAIDWSKVNFNKATKSESFDMAAVDWAELNSSKSAAKSYKAIDWENVSISSDVSALLDYSKVDFNKFSPSSLADINDLNFASLGKNYRKLKWDEIDYSTLNDASKEAIDWTKVNYKKAKEATTFSLDYVDLDEINTGSKKVKDNFYKNITQEMLQQASLETLANLSTDYLNKYKLLPSEAFFTDSPEEMGNLNIYAGSAGIDKITGLSNDAIFGGSGDDILISKKIKNSDAPIFLSGGTGSDTYKVGKGTFTIIADLGGKQGTDLVDLNSFSNNTKGYYIDFGDQISVLGSEIDAGYFLTDTKTSALVFDSSYKNAPTQIDLFKHKTLNKNNVDSMIWGAGIAEPWQMLNQGNSNLNNLKNNGLFDISAIGLPSSNDGISTLINAASDNSLLI